MIQIDGRPYGLVSLDDSETNPIVSITIQDASSTSTHSVHLGKDGNKRANSQGDTWLHVVCAKGFTDIALGFIQHGGKQLNLDERNHLDKTPLMLAIESGNQKIVEALIEAGADIHARQNSGLPGWSVLHTAVNAGDITTTKLLLERDVKLTLCHFLETYLEECRIYENGNALMLAAANPKLPIEKKKELIHLLLAAGDNSHQVYGNKRNILHYIVQAFKEDESIVQLFLEKGVDPNQIDVHGHTPLHFCGEKNLSIAHLLLKHGAKVSIKDYGGYTPLHKAILNDYIKLMELLTQHGASVEFSTNGPELLKSACIVLSLKSIKYLLNQGVNPNKNQNALLTFAEQLAKNSHHHRDMDPAEVLEVTRLFIAKKARVDTDVKTQFELYFIYNNNPELQKLISDTYSGCILC